MSEQSRRRLGALLRWTICVVAVAWLVTQMDWQELRSVWAQADRWFLLLSVLAFFPTPILIAMRLKVLLAVHDIHLTVWQAIKITLAGNFIISALPLGTSGGDAAKAFYIARETPHKHEAVTTVFFDRVVGLTGLILLSGVMALLNWRNPAMQGWGRFICLMVLGLVIGMGTYFSCTVRRLLRLDQLIAWLPLGAHLQRIDRAMLAFRPRKMRLALCLFLAVGLQVTGIVALFFGGWALGLVSERPLGDLSTYLTYLPICFLAGALPIGVMENLFDQMLVGSAGLGTTEAAISLSLLSRVIMLFWALPGGFWVLKSRPPRDLDRALDESPSPDPSETAEPRRSSSS